MRAFVAVADAGSFSAAARRLHIVQPALSRQVRALEEALGVTLLLRARRRFGSAELSAAGRAYLEEARRTLVQSEQATRAAREAGVAAGAAKGRLALGHLGAPNLTLLAGTLAEFGRRHPNVELALHIAPTTTLVDLLRGGEVDAALVHVSPPVRQAWLALEPVGSIPLVAVLPASHPRADDRRPLLLGDLAKDPFVFCPRESRETFHDFVFDHCARAGFQPRVTAETSDLPSIPHLVATGAGVSLVPALVAEGRPLVGVVFRPLGPPAPQLEKALAWRRDDPSPWVASLVEAARSRPPPARPPGRGSFRSQSAAAP